MRYKIKDLKITTSNGIKDAQLYRSDNGVVFYAENDNIICRYREIGHLYGCESCKYCKDNNYKNDFTQNNFYYIKPMSMPNACKCELMEKSIKDYDITFRTDLTHKHPICHKFKINKIRNISNETNINHFIDNKNSCVFGSEEKGVAINGISYKGKQAPFTFYVSKKSWELMEFVDTINNRVLMFNPLRWDTFNFNGCEHKGFNEYINLYGVPIGMTKTRFKKEWDELGKANRHSIRWFNFNTMWFDDVIKETEELI